jgi:hypothetical protein
VWTIRVVLLLIYPWGLWPWAKDIVVEDDKIALVDKWYASENRWLGAGLTVVVMLLIGFLVCAITFSGSGTVQCTVDGEGGEAITYTAHAEYQNSAVKALRIMTASPAVIFFTRNAPKPNLGEVTITKTVDNGVTLTTYESTMAPKGIRTISREDLGRLEFYKVERNETRPKRELKEYPFW